MSRIFLGRPVHWLIAVALCLLGWLAGQLRLHVTDFNLFTVLLILITVAAVVAVLASSGGGRKVTRDPLEED